MESPAKVTALLLAAGSGRRARSGAAADRPKQFRRVAGRSLLAHAIDHLRHPRIDEVRVVIGTGQESEYGEAIGHRMLPAPVSGGDTRQQSVRNGLERLVAEGAPERVLVHDCARPFVPAAVIDRLLDALDTHQAAVPVLPVVDTLAIDEQGLGKIVARDGLIRVQTPQAFRFDALIAAHREWRGADASDDAQMVRAAGIKVATVAGDPGLRKITFDEDFRRAEATLTQRMTTRTGIGFDVHAFGPGDKVWLGGIAIPHDRALTGHSDADVLLHALTDACLGAVGAGDIGEHFPPTDPRWRGVSSSAFLEDALRKVEAVGGRLVHVDATLICEEPRIGPYREEIRTRLAALLGLPATAVSIKATTTDGLGFTGRREGIAAQAIATVAIDDAWPVAVDDRIANE